MTKRILATMLVVLMVFSALMLAACTNSTPANTGDQQTAEPTTTDNAGTPAGNDQQTAEPVSEGNFTVPEAGYDGSEVNLTFYHTMGTNLSDVLNLYIEEFNKLYPNIHITSEKIGSYDDVRDQISTEITVGNQPNIAYCYPDHVALYNLAGAVATLDGLINSQIEVARADGTAEILGLTDEQKADFIPGYYAEGTQFGDGLMYTMPFSKSTEVLYYNKTFFDANGLTVPTTWEEMEATCAKIKEIDPNSIPLGYDSESNWFITMCEQYGSDYTSASGDHYLFNNETNRGFIKMFREWYQKGYLTTQKLYGAYTSGLFTSTDEVKSYMAQSMKRYRQVAETSGDNIQLTYMTGQGSEGVLYSFSRLDGSLYSVIDTERSVNRGLVIDYLKKHYTLVSADEASLQYCFTNQEKSMVITTMKISDSYFTVNYSLVY